jgi:hypothetical protein
MSKSRFEEIAPLIEEAIKINREIDEIQKFAVFISSNTRQLTLEVEAKDLSVKNKTERLIPIWERAFGLEPSELFPKEDSLNKSLFQELPDTITLQILGVIVSHKNGELKELKERLKKLNVWL